MNAPDVDQTINFLSTVFEGAPEGTVWLTSLSLDRDGEVRSLADRDATKITDFVAAYNAPDRATYFCPSALVAGTSGRSKESVAFLTGLHADIDFKSHDTAPDVILKAIHSAALPASLIVESGGGLHVYFLLREALPATPENVAEIERLLHLLADHVGGDHEVAHSAALMRLPGSYNYKRATPVLARVAETRSAARYEIEELDEWLSEAPPLLVARPKVKTNGGGNSAFADYAADAPVDPAALLADMNIGTIHEAQTKAIASLIARGEDADAIVGKVLAATKAAYERGGVSRPWNWAKEEKDIRKSCAAFEKKLDTKKEETADDDDVRPPEFSDDALALHLVDLHGDTLRYIALWSKWMQYDGARWQPEETLRVFEHARRICRALAATSRKAKVKTALTSSRTFSAVEKVARSDPKVAAATEQLDADIWSYNAKEH